MTAPEPPSPTSSSATPPSTLARLVLHVERSFPKPDLFRVKREGRYQDISTAGFVADVRRLALALRDIGVGPGDRVVILSPNRPEWVLTDLAVLCAGAVTVPVYTSLPAEQIAFIVADSGAKALVCADLDLWRKVDAVRAGLPAVERYVLMDGEPPAGVLTLSDLLARGARVEADAAGLFERRAESVGPEDTASIIYTSGTTGPPKGVVLSHRNFVSNLVAVDDFIRFHSSDVVLSFLPLSHVYERMAMFMFLYKGATIAFAESVEAVAGNMMEVRPTILVSVPRLFEKIYARIMEQVLAGPRWRRALFFASLRAGKAHAALKLARARIPRRLATAQAMARRFVFARIAARTGGRIRLFICGGAPMSRDIAEFFLALGLMILPGYGLTETSPVLTGNLPDAYRLGSVGRAIPGVELRIAPDGEILVRGPNVMMGYHRREAETREAMEGGWFHTGDVGRLDEDGYLWITDRKKDILVTSGGKNVAPQPIEARLQSSPWIRGAVVVGNGRKFVSALIVPEFERLEAWARERGLAFAGRGDLCRNPEAVSRVLAEVQRATPGLAEFERVKKIVLLERDFELETGEMTPTLKVRRGLVEREYAALIESLYA